jgi:hypothetical protein
MAGRKIQDEADAVLCLDAQCASRLSLAEWAMRHGIEGRSLNSWLPTAASTPPLAPYPQSRALRRRGRPRGPHGAGRSLCRRSSSPVRRTSSASARPRGARRPSTLPPSICAPACAPACALDDPARACREGETCEDLSDGATFVCVPPQ